jgi:hypothetical protein
MFANRKSRAVVVVGLSLVLLSCVTPPLAGQTLTKMWTDFHGNDVIDVYEYDDGSYEAHVYEILEDGTWKLVAVDFGNPNPVDGTDEGPGDFQSKKDLAKQNGLVKGIVGQVKPALQNTRVGKHLTNNGKGPVVVWNPSDDGNGGGMKPGKATEGAKPGGDLWSLHGPDNTLEKDWDKIVAAIDKELQMGHSFDGNAPLGEQIRDMIKNGKKNDNKGNDGDGSSLPGYLDKYYKSNPAYAEVSLPNPEEKSFVLMGPSTKGLKVTGRTGKSSLQGTSLNFGALGGGMRLGGAGPSAVGRIGR